MTIAAGDKVAMIYTSANRDEDVFVDPQRFDIRRDPNPHLSFGIAEHFCLGVHLARLEGRVFFEELLATFPTIELTGEPRRQRSNLNNALEVAPRPPRTLNLVTVLGTLWSKYSTGTCQEREDVNSRRRRSGSRGRGSGSGPPAPASPAAGPTRSRPWRTRTPARP